jgi:hypothetical protein
MPRIAEIENGFVVRVAYGNSAEWAATSFGGEWAECGESRPQIGWTYDGITFTPPDVLEYSEEPIGDDDAV